MNTFFYKNIPYPDGGIGFKDYYNPVIYSTTERVIGVGENNKPLYQKTVISNTLAAETSETVLTGVDSLKVISLRTNTTYPFYISTYNISGAGTEYGNVRIDASGNVTLYNASRQASVVIEAVLQYTKTADAAGSADYNNLGVPTVHYSTDEQVIGTWIDGKPLYQKTFDLSVNISTMNRTWYTILSASNVQANNMDKIFIDQGASYALDPFDGTLYPIPYTSVIGNAGAVIGWAVTEGAVRLCMSNISTGSMVGKMTLRYTKTTT